MTSATIGSDEFSYEFGTQDASCVGANINPNAHRDSNRTKLTINGQVTTYCYDYADRLVDSSDARFSTPAYDSHGNTTSLGTGSSQTQFEYDSSDRNTAVTEGTKRVEYTRDATDRIIRRVAKENGSTISDERHVYTGSSSSPAAILDASDTVIAKYISLPGNVNVKFNPQSTSAGAVTYSLSNIHGDTMATVDADGAVTGTYITGPFGEKLQQTAPANATDGTTYNYVGHHRKITESTLSTNLIQMGARVYIPELGRFLQVDPVEGGTLNNYVYAMDPVNQWDLNGRFVMALPFAAPIAINVANWGSAALGAAIGIAIGVPLSNAIKNSQSKSKAQTQTKPQVKIAPRTPTRGYTLAPPPAAGIKVVKNTESNAALKNAMITATITQLYRGVKPGGFPTHGEGARKQLINPIFMKGWTKYSVPYPAHNFEVHYSVNEATRQFADVKVKPLYGGN